MEEMQNMADEIDQLNIDMVNSKYELELDELKNEENEIWKEIIQKEAKNGRLLNLDNNNDKFHQIRGYMRINNAKRIDEVLRNILPDFGIDVQSTSTQNTIEEYWPKRRATYTSLTDLMKEKFNISTDGESEKNGVRGYEITEMDDGKIRVERVVDVLKIHGPNQKGLMRGAIRPQDFFPNSPIGETTRMEDRSRSKHMPGAMRYNEFVNARKARRANHPLIEMLSDGKTTPESYKLCQDFAKGTEELRKMMIGKAPMKPKEFFEENDIIPYNPSKGGTSYKYNGVIDIGLRRNTINHSYKTPADVFGPIRRNPQGMFKDIITHRVDAINMGILEQKFRKELTVDDRKSKENEQKSDCFLNNEQKVKMDKEKEILENEIRQHKTRLTEINEQIDRLQCKMHNN